MDYLINTFDFLAYELAYHNYSIEYIFWAMLDSWFLIVTFIIFILIPLLFFILLLRLIIDKLRKIKRINRVVISENAYISLSIEAELSKLSVRKRIQRILNFVAGQEEIIKMIRD